MYLQSINYFRGISILFIVAGHCYYLGQWQINSLTAKIISNLITGGTTFFVFISGFLFHHIYYKKFNYRKFIIQKLKNVLSPYLICSVIALIFLVFIKKSDPWGNAIFIPEHGLYENGRSFFLYLWTGSMLTGYWYVPFIMILFLLSPFFIFFIHFSPALKYGIFLVLLTVSLIIHRPVDNLSIIHSIVYFMPVYLLGILSSINKEKIYEKLKEKEILLLVLAIILAVTQAIFYDVQGNSHKAPFTITVLDIILIQKMVSCIFFMVFLNRFEKTNFLILDKLAAASFSIYFLHPFVVDFALKYMRRINPLLYPMPASLRVWVHTFVLVFLCVFVAKGIKNLFPTKSRMLIGW